MSEECKSTELERALTNSVKVKENSTKINKHLKNRAASESSPTIK